MAVVAFTKLNRQCATKERAGEWQKALELFWELAGKVKLDIIAAWLG